MDKALSQLIKVSKTVGKHSSLIQGGGGNTSVKTADGKYMYIKASGTALKDMSVRKGWRRLRLDSTLSIIKNKSIVNLDVYSREVEVVNRLLLACDDQVTGRVRPSVESHLHAFLDKCTIHLHPAAVLAYACAKKGKTELEKLFNKEKFPPVWVPYADPGFMLAKRIAGLVGDYQARFGKNPQILFLQKHGLLVSAKSAENALRLLRKVINRCNSKLKQLKPGKTRSVNQQTITRAKRCIHRAYFEITARHPVISYFYDDAITAFWRQKDAQKMLLSPALTPDELLYANGPAMWVQRCESERIQSRLTCQIKKGLKPSIAFLVKDVGLFVVGKKKIARTVAEIAENSFFIRSNAYYLGGICSLNKREQNFISEWEADAFRKELAEGSDRR